MRHRLHRFLLSRASAFVLAALLSPLSQAAELGDIAVRSHIGQQLSADIELVMLAPEDADGVPVRLAGPNVYQGANIRMHPALSTLRMSVVKRDGRQFLHLTTFQPVEAELLHLFLELGTGSRAAVRAATIWLTPEPPPAPRPAVVRPPAAVPPVVQRPPAPMPEPITASRTAPMTITPAAPPDTGAADSPLRSPAAISGSLAHMPRADSADTQPPARSTASAAGARPSVPAAGNQPSEAALAAATARAAAARSRLSDASPARPPAACPAGKTADKLKQCVALDAKNAELSSKIVDLEGKVKQLQAALAPAAAATPAAAPAMPAAPAAAATNKAGTVIPPSAPPKNGAKKEKRSGINATTLIAGASVLLLLVIGAIVHFLRKRKFRFSTEKLKVWQGWRKKRAEEPPPPPPPPAEPILGEE